MRAEAEPEEAENASYSDDFDATMDSQSEAPPRARALSPPLALHLALSLFHSLLRTDLAGGESCLVFLICFASSELHTGTNKS